MEWNYYNKNNNLVHYKDYLIGMPKKGSKDTYNIVKAVYYDEGDKVNVLSGSLLQELPIKRAGFYIKNNLVDGEILEYCGENVMWTYLPEIPGYDNQNGKMKIPKTAVELLIEDIYIGADIPNVKQIKWCNNEIAAIVDRAAIAALKIMYVYEYMKEHPDEDDIAKICYIVSTQCGLTHFPRSFIELGIRYYNTHDSENMGQDNIELARTLAVLYSVAGTANKDMIAYNVWETMMAITKLIIKSEEEKCESQMI